jgi:hypothetical protein
MVTKAWLHDHIPPHGSASTIPEKFELINHCGSYLAEKIPGWSFAKDGKSPLNSLG